MPIIECTRCGQTAPSLEKPPFNDDMGREVHENTCVECWEAWLEMQVKIINEMGLLPVNPEHGAILEKNLLAFLKLPSATSDAVDEVGTPPPADG